MKLRILSASMRIKGDMCVDSHQHANARRVDRNFCIAKNATTKHKKAMFISE